MNRGDTSREILGTGTSNSTTGAHTETFNIDPGAGATGDRYVMVLLGSRGASHGNQTMTTTINDVDTFMEVPFDAVAGAEVILSTPINTSAMI